MIIYYFILYYIYSNIIIYIRYFSSKVKKHEGMLYSIINKNDNPKRFILFSALYLGKQIKKSALCKIVEFITNSSSVRMKLIYN